MDQNHTKLTAAQRFLLEGWEEFGIEDPKFVELTQEEKEYAIRRAGGRSASESMKQTQLEFIRDQKEIYLEFHEFLKENPEIDSFLKSIKQILDLYGLKMTSGEGHPYLSIETIPDRPTNYHLNYDIGGLTAVGKYDDQLFQLRPTIENGKISVEVFSYWIDGQYTWDPEEIGAETTSPKRVKFWEDEGYDVSYKPFEHPILNALSFLCRLFPQIRTEFGEEPEAHDKRERIQTQEQRGYYLVHAWWPLDHDTLEPLEPEEKDWSQPEWGEQSDNDLGAQRGGPMWVLADNAKDAIKKVEAQGGDSPRVVDFKTPEEYEGQ